MRARTFRRGDRLLDLKTMTAGLPARRDPAELVAGFVPPPRFADKRFGNYQPDARHPSQMAAVERLRRVAGELPDGRG